MKRNAPLRVHKKLSPGAERTHFVTAPKPTPTSWGKNAQWYDKMVNQGDSYQTHVILPGLTKILETKPGQVLLDVGCGTGYFSHAFATRGLKVTGVDVGVESIAIAQKDAQKTEYFVVASAENMPHIRSSTFDHVICVLSLQNIEQGKQALQEMARVLAPKGTLTLVINHPAFRVPQSTSWEWSADGRTHFRRTDRYLSEHKIAIQMQPGRDTHDVTYSFHRPLSWYLNQAANMGLTLTKSQEWISHRKTDQGPQKTPELERTRHEIPLFMCLQWRK
jgi:ubiquinone/menaquinone biosynthesis C-methylase UbiE